MVKIRPLEIMRREECLSILNPPERYQTLTPEERVLYLSQELPIRLEKINEIVWRNYPPHRLERIDNARERIRGIADQANNLPIHDDMILVESVLADLLLLFKNYQEMVAYITLVYHEMDDYLELLKNDQGILKTKAEKFEIELENAQENIQILKLELDKMKFVKRAYDAMMSEKEEKVTNQTTLEGDVSRNRGIGSTHPDTFSEPQYIEIEKPKIIASEPIDQNVDTSEIVVKGVDNIGGTDIKPVDANFEKNKEAVMQLPLPASHKVLILYFLENKIVTHPQLLQAAKDRKLISVGRSIERTMYDFLDRGIFRRRKGEVDGRQKYVWSLTGAWFEILKQYAEDNKLRRSKASKKSWEKQKAKREESDAVSPAP